MLIVLTCLITGIFYLLTLQRTLQAISVENRTMSPASVWILLIPIVNFIWHFIVVGQLSDSIKAEAMAKNIEINEERPSYNLGLTMCILNCLCLVPHISFFAGILGIFCWLFYWIKISSYKNMLLNAVSIDLNANS